MSSNSIVLNTGKQLTVNTDTSKIFLWENRYSSGIYNNSSYGTTTLVAGTLMGRVTASGKVVPLNSVATDGSQFPVGILADDFILVDEGADVSVPFCIYGDVNAANVIFFGGDTFDTVVDGRLLRDLIHVAGIRLIDSTEMTAYDNN